MFKAADQPHRVSYIAMCNHRLRKHYNSPRSVITDVPVIRGFMNVVRRVFYYWVQPTTSSSRHIGLSDRDGVSFEFNSDVHIRLLATTVSPVPRLLVVPSWRRGTAPSPPSIEVVGVILIVTMTMIIGLPALQQIA